MSGQLIQFENAAQQIETLVAELAAGEMHPADLLISPEWMARAQTVLNGAGSLLARYGSSISKFTGTAEVRHCREQLEILVQSLQLLQPKLQARSASLRNEHLRVKRLQSWANSVSAFK